jgi:uncharacterized membrane protein
MLGDWLHLVHIVASMLWVGAVITLSALAIQIQSQADREAVGRFIGSLRTIGPIVFAPGPLLLLATGIWSVARSDEWDFGQTWVWLSLVLLGAAFIFGAAFQSRVAISAGRAAEAGDDREARHQLARWTRGSLFILAILLVTTWDMVFKP